MRLLVVATLLAGCIEPSLVECTDGTACPSDKVCAPQGGCADPNQIAACAGQPEGAACTLTGIGDGLCRNGLCIVASCGDGILDPEEACDDANTNGGDGCSADCSKLEVCGDAIVDVGEACDDGNTNAVDGCDGCVESRWVATSVIGGGVVATSIGLGNPGQVAVDGLGRIYFADTQNHRIRRIENGVVTTVAGTGTAGLPVDGPATSSPLSGPKGVAVDGLGRIYIADTNNHRIRRVDELGTISTIGGTGVQGSSGNGGPAVLATLRFPQGLAVDGLGRVYIADANNHQIRRIDETGVMTLVAGTTTAGTADSTDPAAAQFNSPRGVAIGADGTLYVADTQNNRIRTVDPAGTHTLSTGGLTSPTSVIPDGMGGILIADTGGHRVQRVDVAMTVSTIAGTSMSGYDGEGQLATATPLAGPTGLALDGDGRVVIADTGNNRIRRIEMAGTLMTVAGSGAFRYVGDGGAAISTEVTSRGVAVDAMGGVLIADTTNHRIRRVDPSGTITTIAGTGTGTYAGDGGLATAASLQSPEGIALDAAGALYIADTGNGRIRKVDASGTITTIASGLSSPRGVAVDGGGLVYISESGSGLVLKLDGANLTTFAGGGATTPSGASIPPLSAELFTPYGIAVDAAGRVFIADADGPSVVRVDAIGLVEVVGAAALSSPRGLAIDPNAGLLYIADALGHAVRRTDLDGAGLTIVAGSQAAGSAGDGAAATAARLQNPHAVAVTPAGLVIADTTNRRVRRVDAGGMIRTIAGGIAPEGFGALDQAVLSDPRALVVATPFTLVAGGTSKIVAAVRASPGWLEGVIGRYPHTTATGSLARFGDPAFGTVSGVTYDDASKRIYLTESTTNRIHRVEANDVANADTWTIQALNASTAGGYREGTLAAALFQHPTGLYLDAPQQQLYVADRGNHAIRRIDLAGGVVELVAGTPRTLGFLGDGGPAKSALLYAPAAITRCPNGDLFVADAGNHRVRRVDGVGTITTVLGDGYAASSGQGAPARDFPVNAPLGLACDDGGNVYVASTNTIRLLPADAGGTVDGTGAVLTIYGPSTATPCVTGLAVIDAATLQFVDACGGQLVELRRQPVP